MPPFFSAVRLFGSHASIIPTALWLLFAATMVVTLVMTFIFFYHWKHYGYDLVKVSLVTLVYTSVTALLAIIALAGIRWYLASL